MASGELRLYKPGKDVESRYNATAEQYHDENTDIALLKKGHYSAHRQDLLDDEQLRVQKDSRELWDANHTFLWNWDGISDGVKKLAKHRNLNVLTTGIVQQYHAVIAPPLTASCGHRCTYAHSKLALQASRTAKYLIDYQGTYYGEGTPFPEGITQANIGQILKSIGTRPSMAASKSSCCRCANADAWFGLATKDMNAYSPYTIRGLLLKSVVNNKGLFDDCSSLRMDTGEWFAETDGQGYYAPILSERTINGNLDTRHVGWHAGLLRPRFHYRIRDNNSFSACDKYLSHRPQWFSNVRLVDGTSVISGLHTPKRYLCPNCLTAAKGLSPHLYWMARGYSLKEAKRRQHREFEIWQKGKNKRWMQNTSIHIKDWEKLPHAYGI